MASDIIERWKASE